RPLRRSRWLPAIAAALLTVPLAAAQPAAEKWGRDSFYEPRKSSPDPVLRGISPRPAGLPVPGRPPTPAPEKRGRDSFYAFGKTSPDPGFAVQQPAFDRDSACAWESADNPSFSGSMSSRTVGGRTVIYEQLGSRGADRVIQKSFGDLLVCMVAEGVGGRGGADDRPSGWMGRARRIAMETRRGSSVQRLSVEPQGGGRATTTWSVAGAARPFDAAAERYRDRLLAVLDAAWDLSMLRGEVSSL